ncbi:unnamed protein product [Fusarium graminearum]|uniref:Chromosome 2, complete genome n=1 Tax=Gibberella zeae (strain ATCC MYA-4620 / CBS 123657 / FGSC 9075 / NRRL 31084 / PH-1) TaxID=229533 RepID=A0A098DHD6_GIBZE|nr:unnamed protein product [Fusarium graminearum]
MGVSSTTELTIQRYMSSMRGIVQALDTVYLWGLQHRVFEAALLYGTSVLDKEAYSQFVSVLETGRPIPHVLSLPEQASQPALAERARGSQVEADLPNELQLDDIFALPESFTPPFQTFRSTKHAIT